MSWAEVENDSVEMEENPYPEEDSYLPQRQHQNGEQVGFRGEEDGPEDDFIMEPEIIQIIPSGEVIVETVDNVVNLAACGCETENDSNSGETRAMQNSSNVAGSVLDGNSFEQDEDTAAPECENDVRHEACSESDRQLFHINEAMVNSNDHDTELFENDHYNLQASRYPDFEHRSEDQDIPLRLAEEAVGSEICSRVLDLQQNVESICSFTGDVEIANNFDDAPEAEVGNLKHEAETYPYEEEDNLSLFVDQESSENPQLGLGEQHENIDTDAYLDVRNVTGCLRNENSDLPMNEGAESDLQAPECDREAVSCLQICTDSQLLVNSSQFPCCNNSQLTTQHDIDEGQGLVSNGSSLLVSDVELRVGEEDLSLVNLSEADADYPKIAYINNDSEAVKTCHTEIDNGQCTTEYSSSFSEDGSLTQSTDNSSKQFLNISSHGDHENHVQMSQAVSQFDQPNSARVQTSDQPACFSSSMCAQEYHSSVNPKCSETTDITLDVNSAASVTVGLLNDIHPIISDPNLVSESHPSSSSSNESTTAASRHSSPAQSQTDSIHINHELGSLALHRDDYDDEELLHELDAELLACVSRAKSQQRSNCDNISEQSDNGNFMNGLQPFFDFSQIQEHNRQLLEQLRIRDEEIEKLTQERDCVKERLAQVQSQVEDQHLQSADNHYLSQIKMLQNTVTQQEDELKTLKEKLLSHDNAAKRAVTTLQNELKSRVDQITKMYEECLKEKDMMVIRFAESEAKNMEAKRVSERTEAKLKEVLKDKDNMANALKTAKSDKLKAVSNFEMKSAEVSNMQKELEKLKEAINSSEYRIKWFQNKLKDELENHKETKSNLEKTTVKLKEAREETEFIRKECHAIVKRYQESEEIKSNSLDKELKLKETELRTQMQEINDTEEIHQMTKRELESLKSQHKDILEEVKTCKDKMHCLEEERKQNHQMIENYQEIMQRQKAENADLKAKFASLATLEDDYKRAQEMIKTLDKDIADLKIINRDLQKDMHSYRERESKMLTLQAELSGTNALLRSDNTNLSNKASLLTGEVEKFKMEIQELETTVKDLSDKYEEEKTRRKDETEKLGASLTEKIKECSDLKQKWEDEVDNSKTLKRRHANNVKDLTRQLQQVRKKLDSLEGKGDSGSMGSRTNSVGSLNSIENSSQPSASVHQPPVQEFPVITEQVEVDKQVLIERIVRLQKSHARKNEKLEFLGEHIQQLLGEIRKKNRIIQCYALREESGTLSSEDMDANKTLLARKGGIMASVYSVHQQDGSMTLELSLQINQKLQAVLEDTLLKNITLKESLDTLGAEIARLSQENRQLQLKLQEIEGHLT